MVFKIDPTFVCTLINIVSLLSQSFPISVKIGVNSIPLYTSNHKLQKTMAPTTFKSSVCFELVSS